MSETESSKDFIKLSSFCPLSLDLYFLHQHLPPEKEEYIRINCPPYPPDAVRGNVLPHSVGKESNRETEIDTFEILCFTTVENFSNRICESWMSNESRDSLHTLEGNESSSE